MTVSPARRLAAAAACLALVTAAGAAAGARAAPTPLLAQVEAPVLLGPPQPLGPEPREMFEPVESEPSPPPVTEEIPPPVQVGPLQAVDPDSIGLIDEARGGFGIDMWRGTSRRVVESLLPALPAATRSRVMRDLMRRLLLSAATAPEGPAGEFSLIALRVERLSAMGDIAAAADLAAAAPLRTADESLARVQVDSLFLAYDNAGACRRVRALVRDYRGPHWQKALIFCQALAGEHVKAVLGLDLLREQGQLDDSAIFPLMEVLTGASEAGIETLPEVSALELAMMRAARRQLPADVLASVEPAILLTVALSPNAPLEVRFEAAERAEAVGALAARTLGQIYESIAFTQEELSNPLSTAEADYGPRGRALLYRAARLQVVPTAQAEVLQRAWELARNAGVYATAVRVNLPVLLALKPSSELAWFAGDAARALYFVGRVTEARAWFDLARQQAGAEAAAAAQALWALAYLAGAESGLGWDPDRLKAWWDGQRLEGGDQAPARAGLLYSLLNALGEPLNGADWEPLLEGPAREMVMMPTPALWYRMNAAAADGRLGETVLLALLSIGQDGFDRISPVALHAVITGLRRVGLEAEARALAIEAAIAAGI